MEWIIRWRKYGDSVQAVAWLLLLPQGWFTVKKNQDLKIKSFSDQKDARSLARKGSCVKSQIEMLC